MVFLELIFANISSEFLFIEWNCLKELLFGNFHFIYLITFINSIIEQLSKRKDITFEVYCDMNFIILIVAGYKCLIKE